MRLLIAVVTWLCLVTPVMPVAAQSAVGPFDAVRASAEIANALAKRDLDAASAAAKNLMEGTSAEKLKDVFKLVLDFGQSQYIDLVYARDFGKTEKDIIYKIDFDKAFLFVRFLYHVDNGAWRLIYIHLKTDNEEVFPKDWVHIYPQ
jgi:hypothetical protein